MPCTQEKVCFLLCKKEKAFLAVLSGDMTGDYSIRDQTKKHLPTLVEAGVGTKGRGVQPSSVRAKAARLKRCAGFDNRTQRPVGFSVYTLA